MTARVRRLLIPAFCIALLVPSAWLAWSARWMPHLDFFEDDGIYWVTAKSIAEGRGYRILSLPGEPYQTKYPPLYPMVLSLAWRAGVPFPANLPLGVLISWSFVPVFLALSWLFLRRALRDLRLAMILLAVVAIHPLVVFLGTTFMADLMFGCCVLAVLLLLDMTGEPTPGKALLAGVATGLAFLVKAAVLPLLLVAPAVFVYRRKFKHALFFLIAAVPFVAGWQLWAASHAPSGWGLALPYYLDYVGYFRKTVPLQDVPEMAALNIDYLLRSAGRMVLFLTSESFPAHFITRLVGLVAFVGVFRLIRKSGLVFTGSFALAYAVELISWNFQPSDRFLFPLLPLVAAGFALETLRLCSLANAALNSGHTLERTFAVMVRAVAFGSLVVSGASIVHATTVMVPGIYQRYDLAKQQEMAAYSWIARNVPAGCVLSGSKPNAVYLYASHPAYGVHVPMSFRRWSKADWSRVSLQAPYAIFTEDDYWMLPETDRRTIQDMFHEAVAPAAEFSDGDVSVYRLKGRFADGSQVVPDRGSPDL